MIKQKTTDGRPGHPWLMAACCVATLAAAVAGSAFIARPGAGASSVIDPGLDLSRFKLVFAEEFSQLSVSARGPGTTWTAHTPWNGDFGDARFSDPGPDGPFSIRDGVLSITAKKDAEGHWSSGLISSVDPAGNGFAQQYGYFEIRAQLPAGPGTWPAFWLSTVYPKDAKVPGIEVDVFEHYGKFPGDFHSGVLIWPKPESNPNENSQKGVVQVEPGSLYSGFHTWGVDVERDFITVYFDHRIRWRCATPPEHANKLMILADLALGSGWPIDETPNPSVLKIDYIRAYAPKNR